MYFSRGNKGLLSLCYCVWPCLVARATVVGKRLAKVLLLQV